MKKYESLALAFALSGTVGVTRAMEGRGPYKPEGVRGLKEKFEALAGKEEKEAQAQKVRPTGKKFEKKEKVRLIREKVKFESLPYEIRLKIVENIENPRERVRQLRALMGRTGMIEEGWLKEATDELIRKAEKESREFGQGLFGAIKNEDLSKLNALLEQGAYVDVQDESERTPLMNAVTSIPGGWLEGIVELLSAGANPNLKDQAGKTALHEAVSLGMVGSDPLSMLEYQWIVFLLLWYDADPSIVSGKMETALQVAEREKGYLKTTLGSLYPVGRFEKSVIFKGVDATIAMLESNNLLERAELLLDQAEWVNWYYDIYIPHYRERAGVKEEGLLGSELIIERIKAFIEASEEARRLETGRTGKEEE